MSVSPSEKIEGMLRFCVPYMVMFVFFTLNLVSFSAPLSTKIEIPLVLMFIYYWSVYRPTLLPQTAVFALGIYMDLLIGFPVGLSAFTLLIMRIVVEGQRLFLTSQSFMVVWMGFAASSAVLLFTQWFLFGLLNWHWTPYVPIILMVFTGTFLFPAAFLFLNLSHKVLPMMHDQYTAVK